LKKLIKTVHAARTASLDPLQKFRFRVTIPGLPTEIGFQTVSGLSHEIGVAEYAEGGYEYTHKLPGKPKVGEITCERGAYQDSALAALIKETLTNEDFRQTIIIEHLDRFGNAGKTYKLAEAWVSKWEGSDLDATSDDVAIEKITIQFEYYLDE
jgi:phage tail-like protein